MNAGNKQTGRSERRTPAGKAVHEVRPWTFLTNHAHVLIVLYGQPDLALREVALQVGITERAVQRIVMELEEGGFVRRQKVGRKNHYKVSKNRPLRHRLEAHRKIGDLLNLIVGK
jgi:predicted transcriptional regulator